MSFTIVAFVANTPASDTTATPVVVPDGVLDGDMIHVFSSRPGSAASNTLSGGSGYVEAPSVSAPGFRGQYWRKVNAGPADSGTTLTVNNTTAMRSTVMLVVTRGQLAIGPIYGEPLATTATVSASGKVASSGTADEPVVFLQAILATGSHLNMPAVGSGYTATGGVTKVGESYRNSSSAQVTGGAVFYSSTPDEAFGGNTLAQNPSSTTGNVLMVWTIPLILAPEIVVTTYNPISTIDAGGWSAVPSGTIHAALADLSDETLAQSPEGPSGQTVEVGFDEVGAGPVRVTGRVAKLNEFTDIDLTVELVEGGSTVIASRTYSLAAGDPAVVTFVTTSEETAAITDREALSLQASATEV